jgi:hypothetical protein
MAQNHFDNFSQAIRNFQGTPDTPELQIVAQGPLAAYYAPFDALNREARVVLVGITPGRQQAVNALTEARQQLASGASAEVALLHAKRTGAFSGAMRTNLTAMLDHIGMNHWLGLARCDDLFSTASQLLQSTSVLPFPVFLKGGNYNGTPDPVGTAMLRQLMLDNFVPVVHALPNAVFIPLGPVPTRVMQWLMTQGHVPQVQMLQGLPHPSGANVERIQYFLGKKPAALLSKKTNPNTLDVARTHLMQRVATLS